MSFVNKVNGESESVGGEGLWCEDFPPNSRLLFWIPIKTETGSAVVSVCAAQVPLSVISESFPCSYPLLGYFFLLRRCYHPLIDCIHIEIVIDTQKQVLIVCAYPLCILLK